MRGKTKYPELLQKMQEPIYNMAKVRQGIRLQKFMNQIKQSVKLAEFEYQKEDGYKTVWVFNHSSCHSAYSGDALNTYKMNSKPGGKQPK